MDRREKVAALQKIYFITIHPGLVESNLKFGPFSWAQKAEKLKFEIVNLRDFAVDDRGTVDDKPFGGGDGMVFLLEPIAKAIRSLPESKIIVPSPKGQKWTEKEAVQHAEKPENLIFICPRYAGLDERLFDLFSPHRFSLGDFVASGGELPALLMVDSILRKKEGVLGNAESSKIESFSTELGGLLEHPQYTRPRVFEGLEVPPVLLSGNHKNISDWQNAKSLDSTSKLRPDLLIESKEEKRKLDNKN